jgi:hypothetical protein
MSTLPIASRFQSAGHQWFESRLPELSSRCRTFLRRIPHHLREEAQAEILASIFQYVLRTAARGRLAALTPYTLVLFVGRKVCQGQRITGTSTTDVLSEACRRRHRLRVISLEDPRVRRAACQIAESSRDGVYRGRCEVPRHDPDRCDSHHFHARPWQVRLADALTDRKTDRPLENARRNVDYPEILDRARAGHKLRRVFSFLLETAGAGRQTDLARELGVSAPRICQLKNKLADILAAAGYCPSGAPNSPEGANRRPGRPRTVQGHLDVVPLNAGTSPAAAV